MTTATLKEIMVRAHEIARRCEGDYQACLSNTGRFEFKDLKPEHAEVIINRIRAAARVA